MATLPCNTISEPLTDTPHEDSAPPLARALTITKPIMALAVPFNVLQQTLYDISNNSPSDLQIPAFPKSQFGNNTKSLSIIPKFEVAENINIVRSLKIESGRISRRNLESLTNKFLFLDDYNNPMKKQMKRVLP